MTSIQIIRENPEKTMITGAALGGALGACTGLLLKPSEDAFVKSALKLGQNINDNMVKKLVGFLKTGVDKLDDKAIKFLENHKIEATVDRIKEELRYANMDRLLFKFGGRHLDKAIEMSNQAGSKLAPAAEKLKNRKQEFVDALTEVKELCIQLFKNKNLDDVDKTDRANIMKIFKKGAAKKFAIIGAAALGIAAAAVALIGKKDTV